MERVHVQLIDPAGFFAHPEGTLHHRQVLELPRDEQVSRAITGRVLRVVPAPEAAPEVPAAATAPPAGPKRGAGR